MNEKPTLPIKVRLATKEDAPFIFNSWLKSFKDSGYLAHSVTTTIFYENHHKLIEKILKRATVYVACDEKYPDQIFSYIVAEKIDGVFVLHYIYTKHNYRKMGIGKLLLNCFEHVPGAAMCCTHLTRPGDRLIAKFNMFYHPYILLVDYKVPEDENT